MQNCFTNQNDYNFNNGWNTPAYAGFNGYNSGWNTPAFAGYNGSNNGWNTPAYAGFNGSNNGWNTPAYAGFNGDNSGWNTPTMSTPWNGFANVPAPETTVPSGNPAQNFGPQSWTGCSATEAA